MSRLYHRDGTLTLTLSRKRERGTVFTSEHAT